MEKILDIWVIPRSCRNEIIGYRDGFLRVRVAAPPVEGEANRLCREVLAKALGVSVSRVEIIRGHRGPRKRVRVLGAEAAHQLELGKSGGND